MKVGNIEGTPEEIKDFSENHGLDLSKYIEIPEKQLANKYILIPAIIFLLSCFFFIMQEPKDKIQLMTIIISSTSVLWLAVSVSLRFKSNWIAKFISVTCLIVLLLAQNIITLKDILDYFESIKN